MSLHKKLAFNQLATTIANLGFTVYVSDNGKYGFYTDHMERRVVSININIDFELKFGGNYHGGFNSSNGWQMETPELTKEGLHRALYLVAPRWANKNPTYTTVEQYLAMYGKSSGFTLFKVEGE